MNLSRRDLLERWWVLPVAGTLGAFGYMGWYATHVTFGKEGVGAPNFQPGEPVRVAARSALEKDWAEVQFTYANRPCTLLRLPQPVPGGLSVGDVHYAAFSRVCTHLGCTVNLVRDPEVLAFAYNYRPPGSAAHPELGCPCHFSVFDPLQAGEAVFGKANAPLPRVRLEARGGVLYATGIEPAPSPGG
ncbi:ubiquinol-cytochrome c reductase iron-sulfur subunit [Deinococcus metallilatus]|uniref:Rieske 2Fe-2S domain-containing protein n=1 Tax=Deinococcus metallilatus TaxID=1211322 RepID=A0AAJ5F6X0_9DEIO|nr:Rieske 2Fe-2S domain-containing protein [Deinococcus metallilatus]MBB5294272.1 Rieske Fe-S protein [Deinococcus metallilatus]QBY09048.1 ubiquinol-cytochrome c reductase iron-sulfur subunit [Deinococcus metallilatus]RXJ10192.1 ubiquinol-cytochrome c reductase iron-sulfur subunit [Deinococcus metallilatus]TLK27871.1 Rieske 2Fe-2S domain-containing protein [Deinococcus metallilatus]GMA16391.1 cytochrome Complex iron-sulfur subunit [Deinococcus metallilatus]